MGTPETFAKTLLIACTALGDETKLARKLGVPVNAVVDWILGNRSNMPTDVFLKAVDIVLTHTQQELKATSAMLEQIRKRRESGRKG